LSGYNITINRRMKMDYSKQKKEEKFFDYTI